MDDSMDSQASVWTSLIAVTLHFNAVAAAHDAACQPERAMDSMRVSGE